MLLTRVVWFSALCAMALGCPTIVPRNQWGARPPKSIISLVPPLISVIIYHSGGSYCTSQASCSRQVKNIQNYHMDTLGRRDIGYNFLIGEDGNVYEGTGWIWEGIHSPGWNHRSLAICFIGNFSRRLPNAIALRAAKRLIQCAITRGILILLYALLGHRNLKLTESPGDALYKEISGWPRFQG